MGRDGARSGARPEWVMLAVVVAAVVTLAVSVPPRRQGAAPGSPPPSGDDARRGRLTARPATEHHPAATPGTTPGLQRLDAPGFLLYVPAAVTAGEPLPLLVMFHGAGGSAEPTLSLVRLEADRYGVIVLAPKSSGGTWDVIEGGFGPDVRRLDQALRQVMVTHRVDPARIAVGGFSDGASYALSIGLSNGDLFGSVLAFSPGFFVAPRPHGRPDVFVSHGDDDRVLAIDRTSRRLVPRLRDRYRVEYHEFRGGHTVPRDAVERGFRTWLGPAQGS